jgi:hypothetical protein
MYIKYALMKFLITSLFILLIRFSYAQEYQKIPYWNLNTQLTPWRLPLPAQTPKIEYIDLDHDGDPDILKTTINDSIPVLWIDDDDDMKYDDVGGDMDNDCLLIDRNQDGIFAGPRDMSLDWTDTDHDGVADIQLIVSNGNPYRRYFFDWDADFMYIIDREKNKVKHFINWNDISLQAWEHSGHSNFFEGYAGNTLFLKMHASSFRIGDMRYSWENPFIFYDIDHDGLAEMTIRLVDTPEFRTKEGDNTKFDTIDKQIDVLFTKKIDWAAISWDLDNNNGPGNEFDFDMSLNFEGPGFNYSDQVHKYNTLKGLPEANTFFYDSRWRQIDELIYPDENTAWNLIFKKGKWTECQFVFDEDNDCNRWERVEFYEPKNLFAIGAHNGGLDNNPQSDNAGDRGEWDEDCSGKGNLYIGTFDGRIHLYGAEWGAWRIDQTAFSFQGYGGLYGRWGKDRLQRVPQKFATVKYMDTDRNGFIDQVEYDLDGDHIFEEQVNLKELEINDNCGIIQTAGMTYQDFNKLFSGLTKKMWNRAMEAVQVAKKMGLNPDWYAFWLQPRTSYEKYDYGYWLNFYLYHDLRYMALTKNNKLLARTLDKAYYSGNWKLVQKQ